MPLLPKTTLYGCAALATLAASLPQPRGDIDGKVSLSLSLDAPTTINDISEFTIAGRLKNEGPQDILVVKDPSGILYDFFTADALFFERTDSKEEYPVQPSFVGYRAKWDIKTYLGNNLEEDDSDNDEDTVAPNKSRPNGRRASSDSESSSSSGSDDSHRLYHTDTGLTGYSGSESGSKKYHPGTTLPLPAGETITFNYKVGDVYDFSKSGAGSYTFELKHSSFYVLVDDKISEVEVNVKGLKPFKIQGKLKGKVPRPRHRARDIDGSDNSTELNRSIVKRTDPTLYGTTTAGCSDDQIAVIDEAAEKADEYVKESNAYIIAMNGPTDRYTNWFGKWNIGPVSSYMWRPRNQVAEMFDSLSKHSFMEAGDAGGYTYDCGCTDSTHAFVGDFEWLDPKTKEAIIFLCDGFRDMATPVEGRNSRAGALVHEATHFRYHEPACEDYAYGHQKCGELATKNPFHAATNSDSYEFFAENSPFRA